MIPPAEPIAEVARPWGLEFELADGSVWRPTPSGCWLVRFPARHNTPDCRRALRERHSVAAAALTLPPARPPALAQAAD